MKLEQFAREPRKIEETHEWDVPFFLDELVGSRVHAAVAAPGNGSSTVQDELDAEVNVVSLAISGYLDSVGHGADGRVRPATLRIDDNNKGRERMLLDLWNYAADISCRQHLPRLKIAQVVFRGKRRKVRTTFLTLVSMPQQFSVSLLAFQNGPYA